MMKSNPTPPGVKRSRACRPKTRTGCLTCKSRRVKCDEQRPDCARCRKMGIRCLGYPILSPAAEYIRKNTPDRARQLIERPPRTSLGDSQYEKRTIDFYINKAAPNLAGFYHGSFWKERALQMCHSEPLVFDALIALSTVYETIQGVHPGSPTDETVDDFARRYYNHAVRLLVKRMDGLHSITVPLVACIIFICIECVCGNVSEALRHIDAGKALLESWAERLETPKTEDAPTSRLDDEFIKETLLPIFCWLITQSSVYGKGLSTALLDLYVTVNEGNAALSFSSLEDAYLSHSSNIAKAVQFVHAAGRARYLGESNEKILKLRDSTLARLERWRSKFDTWVAVRRALGEPIDEAGCALLIANNVAIRLWLKAALQPTESDWDAYLSEYEEIVCFMEIAVGQAPSTPDSKIFVFESGYIAPLQVVSWRCRYPTLRRKALSLMKRAQRREVLLDTDYTHEMYVRIMEIEEASFGLSPSEVPNDLPPEEARIAQIDLPPLPRTRYGRPVNFLSRTGKLQKGWHVQSEYFEVNDIKRTKWSDIGSFDRKQPQVHITVI